MCPNICPNICQPAHAALATARIPPPCAKKATPRVRPAPPAAPPRPLPSRVLAWQMAGGFLKPGFVRPDYWFCVVCNVSMQFQHLCGRVPVPSRPGEDRCPSSARACSQLCDLCFWSVAFVSEPTQEPLPRPLVICHMRTILEVSNTLICLALFKWPAVAARPRICDPSLRAHLKSVYV